jgi:hypothetical protein
VLDVAEVVGDPVLAAMPNQQDVHLPQLAIAVRAAQGPGVDVGWLGELSGLPPRAADHPGDDVLEPAEDGAPVAGGLVGAEPVARLNPLPAPATSFCHFVVLARPGDTGRVAEDVAG